MKHTGGQVEDGAETGLQGCGTTSVDHHHLVYLFRILMGQEGAERHTRQAEKKTGHKTGYNNQPCCLFCGSCLLVGMYISGRSVGNDSYGILACKYLENLKHTPIH